MDVKYKGGGSGYITPPSPIGSSTIYLTKKETNEYKR